MAQAVISPRKTGRRGNAYQIFILVLTVLSLLIMVWLLLPISQQTRNLLNWYDNAICFIFLYDFAMHMIDARKNKTSYFIKERGWLDLLGSIPSLGFTTYGGLLRLARLSRLARITRLLRGQNKKELVDDIVNNRNQYTAFITILMTIIGALASILSSILVGAPAAAEEAPIGPDGQPIPAEMLAPASRADIVQLQNELAALRQMMEKISGADGQVRAAEIKE